jgi:hypothetical protein
MLTPPSDIPSPPPLVARVVRPVVAPLGPLPVMIADEPSDVPVIDLTLSIVSVGRAVSEPLPEPSFDWGQLDPRQDWMMTSVAALDPAPLPDVSGDWRLFLTGALRKTREGLKDARSGIRDALAGFGRAVRRVSPFFNTTTLALYR